MAEKSLDIYIRMHDQATEPARGLARRMVSDLERVQTEAFGAAHSAREREERDVEQHYGKLRERYERQAKALEGTQSSLESRLQAARQQLGAGIAGGEDPAKIHTQLEQVRALRAQNASVLAGVDQAASARRNEMAAQAAEEAAAVERRYGFEREADTVRLNASIFAATHDAHEREIYDAEEHFARLAQKYDGDADMRVKIEEAKSAKVAEINKRYEAQAAEGTGRGGSAFGGLAARMARGAGVYMAVQAAGRGVDAAQAWGEAERAKAGGNVQESLAGQIKLNNALADMGRVVPLLGDGISRLIRSAQNTDALERMADRFKQMDRTAAELGKTLESMTGSMSAARSEALGVTRAEQLRAELVTLPGRRRGEVQAAEREEQDAREGVPQAFDIYLKTGDVSLVKAAENRLRNIRQKLDAMKEAMPAEEEALEMQATAAQQEEVRVRGAQMTAREIAVRLPGDTMHERQQREAEDKALAQKGEMGEIEGRIELRTRELADREAWERKEVQGRLVQELTPDMTRQQSDETTRRVRAEVAKEYKHRMEKLEELSLYRETLESMQGRERVVLEKRQATEVAEHERGLDLRLFEAQNAGPDRASAEARERKRFEVGAAQELEANKGDLKVAQALNEERNAMEARFARDRVEQARQWNQERLDNEASTSRSVRVAWERELERIKFKYAERRRKTGEDTQAMRDEEKSEVAAMEYRRRRQEQEQGDSLREQLLRGMGAGKTADLSASKRKFDEMRERADGDKEQLGMIGGLERLERAQIQASGPAHETQAIESRFATRVGGFEVTPETQALQQMQGTLREQFGQLIGVVTQLLEKDPILISKK